MLGWWVGLCCDADSDGVDDANMEVISKATERRSGEAGRFLNMVSVNEEQKQLE